MSPALCIPLSWNLFCSLQDREEDKGKESKIRTDTWAPTEAAITAMTSSVTLLHFMCEIMSLATAIYIIVVETRDVEAGPMTLWTMENNWMAHYNYTLLWLEIICLTKEWSSVVKCFKAYCAFVFRCTKWHGCCRTIKPFREVSEGERKQQSLAY